MKKERVLKIRIRKVFVVEQLLRWKESTECTMKRIQANKLH